MPNRARSKRDMALAIISKAQHARPNDRGKTDDLRLQFSRASMDVTARLRLRSSGTSTRGSASGEVFVALRLLM